MYWITQRIVLGHTENCIGSHRAFLGQAELYWRPRGRRQQGNGGWRRRWEGGGQDEGVRRVGVRGHEGQRPGV